MSKFNNEFDGNNTKLFIMRITLSKIALFLLVSISMVSCSKEEEATAAPVVNTAQLNAKYSYIAEEEEVLALINNYRVNIGLNSLEKVDYISFKSEEHDKYMISTGQMTHNFFQDRYENIVQALGATNVSENLAYNFNSAEAVFNAWLNSPSHKANIDGNFTHFGISIRANAEGKKYYTNIFMKK